MIIFVAGLLPVLGRSYTQAGLGLGIATVLGFALQADVGSPGQIVRAEPAFEQAYTMWLRHKPVRWLGETLRVAVGYRTLRTILSDHDAVSADLRASQVAAVVAAREPAARESAPPSPGTGEPAGDTPSVTDALGRALRTLDRIETAARARDTAAVPDAPATRRAFARASVRSVLTWRSQMLRHALRTAIGVLLTFLVAWATVGARDPLVTAMATASFAVLQISWTQSLFKAKQRILGVSGGVAVMAVALWLLPASWLLSCHTCGRTRSWNGCASPQRRRPSSCAALPG